MRGSLALAGAILMVAASTMGPAGADHAEGGHHDHDHDHEEGKVTTEATLSADADEAEAADEADVDAKGDSDKGATFSKKLPVRLGSDGRPLLFAPKLELCQKRVSHGKLGDHHYFLSWREPWNKFEDWDWFNARNFCRERCMDLISFETAQEFKMFEEVMSADNISSIYTSGRKCNFQGKGCDAAHFQPINVNGWFWAGASNTRLPPTNKKDPNTFWSTKGPSGKPQPDNHEGLKAGKLRKVSDPVGLTIEGLQEWYDEACLAVLNNKYRDGIKWHDVPCFFRSKLVCEDSDELVQRVLQENPGAVIPDPTPVSPQ